MAAAPKNEARAKKVPKLTVERALRVVEGLQNWRKLGGWLSLPKSRLDDISQVSPSRQNEHVITYWLENDPFPSWRRLLWALGGIEEKAIVDSFRHYAEPPTDSTFTIQNMTQALATMPYDRGFSTDIGVPFSIRNTIESNYLTSEQRKEEVAKHYVRYTPGASWSHLAGWLYYCEQKAALQHVQRYVQRPVETTLTLTNLCNVLKEVEDWYNFAVWLNIPFNTIVLLNNTDPAHAKEELLSTFLEHHPAPSWAIITEALYKWGHREEMCHRVLQGVRRLYGTGLGKQLFHQAMKDGFVESLNIKVIFFGTAGAGKTCSKAVILGLPPPVNRVSTDMAERPVRAVCVDMKADGEWLILGPEEVKEELAAAIRAATIAQVAGTGQESPEDDSDSATATLHPRPSILSTIGRCMCFCSPSSKQTTSSKSQQAPSPPGTAATVTEAATRVTSMPEASSTEDELVNLIDKAVVSKSVARFKWVYFLDTGGQPQFHEVFRAFLKRASLCMFVQKLSERLDEYPLVEYFDESSRLVGKPYRTAVTHQQILNHSVRTMLSHDSREGSPKIVVVGTHVDKEYQCSETREAKNQKLIKLLAPAFPEQIVYYGQSRKQVIFPLNARCPGEAEKRVAKEIRQVILNHFTREPDKIPLRWYALEQALQELARKYGREVLKKEECFAAALRLHFDEESFEAALEYLHDLNIIFYYPNILPEFVFCNPQVVLDKVSELVKRSHQMKDEPTEGVACSAEWGKFKAFGLVTVQILGKFPKHYISAFFSPVHLVKLLKELLILADLNEVEYFMPALLQILDCHELVDRRAACHSAYAPLVVYFPDGLKLGMLCSLVVFLLSPENRYPSPWKIQVDTGNPTCLFRNCIKFTIPGVPGSVTLFDSFEFFEIHACVPSHVHCQLVRNAVFTGLEKAFVVLSYDDAKPLPAILCSCDISSWHLATISSDQKWWICSTNSEVFGDLQDKHRFWMAKELQPIPAGHKHLMADTHEGEPAVIQHDTITSLYGSIPLTTSPLYGSRHSFGSSGLTLLDDGDIMEITDYLINLDKTDIYNLGMVLGLRQPRVKAMEDSKTFLDDVVAAWIRKKDFVERRGQPTWETLVRALRHQRIGQTGLAKDISRDKNIGQLEC